MAIEAIMKELNFDRYDRNARLRPALFTILPMLVLVAIWYPKIWSLFGALASLGRDLSVGAACASTWPLA